MLVNTASAGQVAGVNFGVGGTQVGTLASTSTYTYLYAVSNAPLLFGTNNTERARIDASGNLGLGVTPSAWGTARTALQIKNGAALQSDANANLYLSSNTYLNSSSNDIYISTNEAASYTQVDGTHRWYTAASGTAGTTVSFSETMRIDSSGNLLVGKTAFGTSNLGAEIRPDGQVNVTRNGNTTMFLRRNTSDGSIVAFSRDATGVGSISVTTSATAYNTSSDYRLKDIDGPVANSGAYIDALKPVQGSWKADGSRFIGLLAHEVQEVSETQIATGEKDGEEMQAMDYSSPELIANLIAEIQSMRLRLAQLEG